MGIMDTCIEALLGGFSFSLEAARQTIQDPASLVVFILSMLVGGPLAEELGWRGYALVGLQEKWTALKASVVLGAIHVLWHSPLFFIPGTSQGSIGLGNGPYWLWSAQVIAGAVFYTLVFNNSRQSTLSAVLIHFMSNTTTTLSAQVGGTLPMRTEAIRTVILIVLGIIIVVVWGPRSLARHPRMSA
jgi:membrane protease YdiL (CAAX protease family)